jgi:IS66 Orf2 like protein
MIPISCSDPELTRGFTFASRAFDAAASGMWSQHPLPAFRAPSWRGRDSIAFSKKSWLASVMLEAFLPASATRIVVYLEPISMRWGPERLRILCAQAVGIEPDPSTAFVFTNKARDCLLLLSTGPDGDHVLLKKLEKGGFLLPAPEVAGKSFVVLRSAVLARLFR